MGPAFSKLMTKQSNVSSAPENVIPQFTVEDMEFDATVISSESNSKPDVSILDPQVAPEPDLVPNPEPVVEALEEPAIEALEEPAIKVEVEETYK